MTIALTEAEIVADDETGLALFDDQTDVIDVVAVPVPVPVKPLGRIRRATLRVALGVVRALLTIKRTVAQLRAPATRVAAVAYVRRLRKAYVYRPQHRAARYWYGVQRSTAQRNAANVRASRAAAEEGELPELPPEFVGWVDQFIETLREEQSVLHPPGRHFICS